LRFRVRLGYSRPGTRGSWLGSCDDQDLDMEVVCNRGIRGTLAFLFMGRSVRERITRTQLELRICEISA